MLRFRVKNALQKFRSKPIPKPETPSASAVSVSKKPHTVVQQALTAPQSLSRDHVMQLQRTIGNQAVIKLFKGMKDKPIEDRSSIQRRIKKGESSDELDLPILIHFVPVDFNTDIPPKKWDKKSLKGKTYTFNDGDTIGDLAIALGAHEVKLMTRSGDYFSLVPGDFSAPLINNARYVVHSPWVKFSGLDTSGTKVTKKGAVTLVTDLSSMLKEVSKANEVQAMMMGRSVVVTSNTPEEFANLKRQLGLETDINRTTVPTFINSLVAKYKDKHKNEITHNNFKKMPVNVIEADAVANHFSNSDNNVLVKRSASDFTSLSSELIILYGHAEDTDTRIGESSGKGGYTWHAEQNLLLALINYLAFSEDEREELKGVVIGGHKSACNVCKGVLPTIKLALERITDMEVHFAEKGNINVHYNPNDAVSLVRAGQLHSAVEDILDQEELQDERLRIENLQRAVQIAAKLQESQSEWREKVGEEIEIPEDLRLEYLGMEEDEIIRENNCLITAMNLGTEVSGDPLEIIRNQVLGSVNIPLGQPLIDDQRVLRIIATVLNIRNSDYRIITEGSHNDFHVDNNGIIRFFPEGFPENVTQAHIIDHTPGTIGHFEYRALEDL